ncbi:hypothetical protein HDU93_008542 [Gonapodya sp. JEL0774]|nr:hypothetical protein HDU93_008542 [Gonapodya sp. JEL0774]
MPPNPPLPQRGRTDSTVSLGNSDDEILRLLASELSLSRTSKQRQRRRTDEKVEKDSGARSRARSRSEREREQQIETSKAVRARFRDMDKNREKQMEPVCFADSAEEARSHVRVRDGEHEFVAAFADGTASQTAPEYRKGRSTTSLPDGGGIPAPKSAPKRDVITSSRSMDRPSKATSGHSTRSKSPGAQSWTSLVKREEDMKERYHTSTKSLLQSLADERSRYSTLESSYQQLLADVRSLQSNHVNDLQHAKRKSESALRALQRALIVKTEEHAAAEKELSVARAKYDKDSRTWLATAQGLEQQVQVCKRELAGAVNSYEDRLADAEAAHRETVANLEAKCTQKDGDIKRLAQAYKSKEADWAAERDTRMKLDMRQIELDHELARRQDENVALQYQVDKLTQEVAEARSASRSAASAIDQQRAELSAAQKSLTQAREEHDSLAKDIDRHVADKAQLDTAKDALVLELRDRDREIADMERDLDLARNENKERLLQFTEALEDVRTALLEAQREAKELKERETSLRRDKQRLEEELRATLDRATLAEERLEVEVEQRSKDRTQTHSELLSLQEKLTVAKSAMEDEVSHLRSAVTEKDTALDAFAAEHDSLSRRIEGLSQELARSRTQLQQKSQQATTLSEDLSKLRMENSESSGKVFALEARVAEAEAVETALRRQVGALQAQLADKERQLLVAVEKQKDVLEQVRRLDEEMQVRLRSCLTM